MNITFPLIIGTAAVDSINPCALAVLVFLILYLMSVKNRRHMLVYSLVYIGALYVVYFCAGLGLLGVIQYAHITKYFYYFAAGLSIIFGLINLKTYFWGEGGFKLAIPESKKGILKKYMIKATLPAALILGVLVALFELPCTGGVYLAILSLLAEKETFFQAFLYLILYNFIFVLPLLIIVLAVYFGVTPEKLETWRQAQKKGLRLLIVVVLVALGVLMLVW